MELYIYIHMHVCRETTKRRPNAETDYTTSVNEAARCSNLLRKKTLLFTYEYELGK